MPNNDLHNDSEKKSIGAPHSWGQERRGWHIDSTISFGDLLAVVTIFITIGLPLLVWGNNIQNRITALETVSTNLSKELDEEKRLRDQQRSEDKTATQQSFSDLKMQINRMDDKLDKIADKIGARK